MTPHEFIAKWRPVTLSERSACQQHFLDLCELLNQPKPVAADPEGAWYTFEKGVRKTEGGNGWADVWMRGHFGWEYKGKHRDLVAAYRQLQQYREDLQNPPLLVVCDMDRFEIHTNFTGTVKRCYQFSLEELAEPDNLEVLRKLFTNPEALKPGQTTEALTQQAAELFGQLADGMRVRGIPAPDAAHFLMKLMFCMFAEDIGLLSNKVFSKIVSGAKNDPSRLAGMFKQLFEAMAHGGNFGADEILYFNGGLFADTNVIELRPNEINVLSTVCQFDWSDVEPSIFGTLFERTLDPAKRAQIGAHYTSRDDILTLLEPVMMAPLRREWADVKGRCERLLPKIREAARKTPTPRARKAPKDSKPRRDFDKLIRDFVERLAHVTVLDPACGSGNFLYVAINLLLDLEKEVNAYASSNGLSLLPHVRPTQLAGIEINPYAQQLAQVVIWIGYLQWMHHNGYAPPRNPVLEPIESIHLMDAIIDLSDPEHPLEPEWPPSEFIVGNPPFLGGKLLRTNLGDEYVDAVFKLWDDRVKPEADLCCYWFEKARRQIERKKCQRAGLLATQGIRGGANRETLKRIKKSGDIFFAESDREWVLNGANVHVSMVGFDDGNETLRSLDAITVDEIHANLTSSVDVTEALRLACNRGLSLMAGIKVGEFEVPDAEVRNFLHSPNPNSRPASDVIVPWCNGKDLTDRYRNHWIIDFGTGMTEETSSGYEQAFERIVSRVKPMRATNSMRHRKEKWWIHGDAGLRVRTGCLLLRRYIATPRVTKFRLFTWLVPPILPDAQLIVFPRDDDFFFGVLHSRLHEVWALKLGTRLETRPRYTPTTCFETFPFPKPTKKQDEAIAAAAKELDTLRNNWLNPPEWTREEILEFPGSVDGPWRRYVVADDGATERGSVPVSPKPETGTDPEPETGTDPGGIGTVRYPRTVPKDEECAKALKKRTLTKLYNERPTWLDLAHKKLDEAVFAAYGWDPAMSDEEILAALLKLNLERAKE